VTRSAPANAVRGLVVCGMHRSGTTFVGELIRQFRRTAIIHEPLNREFGLAGVPSVYPCDLSEGEGRNALRLVESVLAGRGKFVRRVVTDRPLKAFGRLITGGRTGVDVTGYRLRRAFQGDVLPVIKDPFLVLMAKSLLAAGFGVVVVVRHPAAVWQSIGRMGWKLDLSEFSGELVHRAGSFAGGIDRLVGDSELRKFACLWRAIHEYVLAIPAHSKLCVVKHEDLCMRPGEFLEELGERYGLRGGGKVDAYVERSMRSELVSVSGSKLHEFRRDSRALARAWMGRISSSDEQELRVITEDVVKQLYGGWYPSSDH